MVLLGLPPDPLRIRIWQFGRRWTLRDIRVDGEALDLGVQVAVPSTPLDERK